MGRLRVGHPTGIAASENNVVCDDAVIALARLQAPGQAEVVVDLVIGGAVIQVDVVDTKIGPKTEEYPADCLVEGNQGISRSNS
ncbi:hypothetical protein ACFLS1_10255 [Verrucomicrobiota bacterium]